MATPSKPTAPSPQKSDPNTVEITAAGFSPADLPVKVGATVTWVNTTRELWNVTFDASPAVTSDIPAGTSFTHTVTAPGDHKYHCKLHPGKVGTLKAT